MHQQICELGAQVSFGGNTNRYRYVCAPKSTSLNAGRFAGGATDVPTYPFASSEIKALVAESKRVFDGVEDAGTLAAAKEEMAEIVRGISLSRQGPAGNEDNPWESGEAVVVWTNGTGTLVFQGRGRTDGEPGRRDGDAGRDFTRGVRCRSDHGRQGVSRRMRRMRRSSYYRPLRGVGSWFWNVHKKGPFLFTPQVRGV